MPNTRASITSGDCGKKHANTWEMGKIHKFILQESEQKAREIRIKANEEYSIELAELTMQSMERVNQQKIDEINRIKAYKTIREGQIRSRCAILLAQEKEKIYAEIMKNACEICRSIRLSPKLATDAIELFKKIAATEKMIIYVLEEDRKVIIPLLADSVYTFKPLDLKFLGGIVICNADKTVLVNNSYLERARKIENLAMPLLQKELFN